MDVYRKASLWIFGTLLSFAFPEESNHCCPLNSKRCDEIKPIELMAGYNASSRIDKRSCLDIFTSASFTYLQPYQDTMELGAVFDNTYPPLFQQRIVNQRFTYKPGFKVALGLNLDQDYWDAKLLYTWFRGSDTIAIHLEPNNSETIGFQIFDGGITFDDKRKVFFAAQKWKLSMDFLDLDLTRNYFVGEKLTFSSSFGARAAWIHQDAKATFIQVVENFPSPTATEILDKKSSCWGVGPRASLKSNWNIGKGFRFYGNEATDILFTQYRNLKIINTYSVRIDDDTHVSQKRLNCVRAHLDLEFGLGWGSYFDCKKWHLDVSAGYGFQVFFNQNMLRQFLGTKLGTLPQGNLYLHGLTATARFDF